jgi:hypothetical protein
MNQAEHDHAACHFYALGIYKGLMLVEDDATKGYKHTYIAQATKV